MQNRIKQLIKQLEVERAKAHEEMANECNREKWENAQYQAGIYWAFDRCIKKLNLLLAEDANEVVHKVSE